MKNTPRKHTYIISSITIVCQKQPRWVQITRRFLRRSTVDAIINVFRLTLLHCACDFYSTPKTIPVLPSSTTYCYVLHISRPRFESFQGRKAKNLAAPGRGGRGRRGSCNPGRSTPIPSNFPNSTTHPVRVHHVLHGQYKHLCCSCCSHLCGGFPFFEEYHPCKALELLFMKQLLIPLTTHLNCAVLAQSTHR